MSGTTKKHRKWCIIYECMNMKHKDKWVFIYTLTKYHYFSDSRKETMLYNIHIEKHRETIYIVVKRRPT